jgi:NAD(P)H-hydrate epimerase
VNEEDHMPVVSAEVPSGMRWFTDSGIAVPVVTAEQMREIDRIAIDETGPNLFQMMENAGRNLALQIMEILGVRGNTAKVIVLAGGGGNGGGGICAARHLANREVDVKLCLSAPERLGPVGTFQRKVFGSASGTEVSFTDVSREAPDLIVDALVGYGLQSTPAGSVAELIRWANGTGAPILALDVPSGVDSTTGSTPGDFIAARWTMTLALPKSGLVPEKTGHLILADLGIPRETYRRAGVEYTAPFGARFRVSLTRRSVPVGPSRESSSGAQKL